MVVTVEVKAFGNGMKKLFEGVSEVFAAIGTEEPDRLEREKAKWNHNDAAGENDGISDEIMVKTESGILKNHGCEKTVSIHPDRVDDAGDRISKVAEKAKVPKATDEQKKGEKEVTKESDAVHFSVSQDDITKIIVQKIKQNRSNNEKIGQLLKAFGAARVGDLPEDKYEEFLTDISQI